MSGTNSLFKDLFKKATNLFIKNAFCFIKLFIIFFIPLAVMYIYFWGNQKLIQKIIDKFTLPGFVLIDDAINYAVLAYVLLYLVAIVKSIHAADRGGNPGAIASYRKAFGIFGSYLWVKILTLFKILCWSLLLIVPGVVAGVFCNFSGMALLVDDQRGKEALIRSQKIIKPNIVKYLTSFILVSIFVFIAIVVTTLNFESVITFFKLNGRSFMVRAMICVEVGFYALVLSFFLTFYYCLYSALREGAEN